MTARKTVKDREKKDDNPLGFEESLQRLEVIVAEMEGGELSLEKMMADFEEGQKLIRSCTRKLNEVERKIEILVKKGDEVGTEPFEDQPSEEEGDSKDKDEATLF